MAQNISVPANTINKAMLALYLKALSQTSLSKTKQTLKDPFTPNPAIIVNTMNQILSKDAAIPTIPIVVIPQL